MSEVRSLYDEDGDYIIRQFDDDGNILFELWDIGKDGVSIMLMGVPNKEVGHMWHNIIGDEDLPSWWIMA